MTIMTTADTVGTAIQQRRSIQEFRLDFIIEEELACDLDFANQLAAKCKISGKVADVTKVQHEADLRPPGVIVDRLAVLSINIGDGQMSRVALLIEDKITASPAWQQAARYREAGKRYSGQEWDTFKTVIVAPSAYVGERTQFDTFVSIEELMGWLCPLDISRAEFRRGKLTEAIEKKNSTGVKFRMSLC